MESRKNEPQAEVGISYKVISSQSDKSTMDMEITSFKFGGNDLSASLARAGLGTQQVIFDSQGQMIENKWIGANPNAQGLMGDTDASFLVLPEKRIRIGDSWTAEFKFPSKSIDVTYTLKSVSDVGGRKVALIEGQVAQDPDVKLEKPMTIKVDLADGMPIEQVAVGKVGSAVDGIMTLRQVSVTSR